MIAYKDPRSAVDVLAGDSLPLMHKDLFDKIVVAQGLLRLSHR
jgi:hypothetical protein